MTTPNARFQLHARHEGLSSHAYLRSRVYEDAAAWAFPRTAGRPVWPSDLDLLVPVLLATLDRAGPGTDFEALVAPVAAACGRLLRAGEPRQLATDLVWACSVRARQEAQQPLYFWAWLKVVEALQAVGGLALARVPFDVAMSRQGGLLAARALAAPDGGPVVLLNHEVVYLNDYAWMRYRLDREQRIWAADSPRDEAMWGLAAFLGLAERALLPGHCVDPRVPLPVPPDGDVPLDAADAFWIARFGEVVTSFLILHEFGHIYHGHLAEPIGSPARAHQVEFEADEFALRVLESRPSFRPFDLGAVCTLLHDLARARAAADLPAATDSHPSHLDRVARLVRAAGRVAETDKAGLARLATLSDWDRQARGLLVTRPSRQDGGPTGESPSRFRPPSAANPREAAVLDRVLDDPATRALWPPPDDPTLRDQIWRNTQYLGAQLETFQTAIREIVTDAELRPPFEIDAITHEQGIVRFVPVRLDPAVPVADHFVPLLTVRLGLGTDRSLHLWIGGDERQPTLSIPAGSSGRPRTRYVAVTLGAEVRYYEAGAGLIVPQSMGGLDDRVAGRFDERGNLFLDLAGGDLHFPSD